MNWLARLRQIGNAMVGMPSYDAYVAHMAAKHPDREPMDEVTFLPRAATGAVWWQEWWRCC